MPHIETADLIATLALLSILIAAMALPRPKRGRELKAVNPVNGVVVEMEHYRNGNRRYLNNG
jgi:hypothetical protein